MAVCLHNQSSWIIRWPTMQNLNSKPKYEGTGQKTKERKQERIEKC
jgi:hypothetical protein